MQITNVDGQLRACADVLLALGRILTGKEPQAFDDWYKLVHKDGSGFCWFRVLGDRASKYPKRSIHLAFPPLPEHCSDAQLCDGDAWWGGPSRDITVKESDPVAFAFAIEAIARGFRLDEKAR
jgi:hypothetical protein